MTPRSKHHDPDNRPSGWEILFAACLFLMVLVALWFVDALKGVTP